LYKFGQVLVENIPHQNEAVTAMVIFRTVFNGVLVKVLDWSHSGETLAEFTVEGDFSPTAHHIFEVAAQKKCSHLLPEEAIAACLKDFQQS
jgi:hypothetical protein